MKKIMFNDQYGLTEAVLEGCKTMTRRVVNNKDITHVVTSDGVSRYVEKESGSYHEYIDGAGKTWLAWSPFKIGDVIAIAQSYHALNKSGFVAPEWLDHTCQDSAGYENKMFVRADLMPHRIRITGIKFERLQDISDEDCIKEGIVPTGHANFPYTFNGAQLWKDIPVTCYDRHVWYRTARQAFSVLIDKVSKRGTWQRNPWVFAYSFELIQ